MTPWRRRVPYVAQLESAECGAACLTMILSHHGAFVPLPQVRKACGVSRDGASARELLLAARHFGLEGRALKVDTEGLARVPLPAILHWGFNHFVVVERVVSSGIHVVDPAHGRRRVSREELGTSFTGIVLTFSRSPRFRPVRRSRSRAFPPIVALSACLPVAGVVLAAAILLELVSFLFPASDQFVIDQVVSKGRASWLYGVALVLGVGTLLSVALGVLRRRALLVLGYALDHSLMTRFVEHIQRLPIPFFEHRTAGDLMQRAEANQGLRDLAIRVITGALDALLVIGFSAMMLAYDPTLGALVMGLNVARLVVVAVASARSEELASTELLLAGQERAAAVEAFSMPEAIRAFGSEPAASHQFVDRMARRLTSSLELRRHRCNVESATGFFDAVATSAVLWVGGNAVIDHEMPIGVLVAFFALRLFLQNPLESLIDGVTSMREVRGVLSRLDDVLASEPDPCGTTRLSTSQGAVDARALTFRYAASSRPLVEDVSLEVAPGERVAIVGRIGSGKSTLARLVSGLLHPTEGTVTIDGHATSDVLPADLRRHVAMAMQEPFLFDTTVFANIALGNDDATLEQVRRAARLACIDDVIEALPEGYSTRIGLGGARLSGGQRKRIALARALLGNPSILVLDEITASVDVETERQIEANLSSLKCTQIAITHRMSSVRTADKIVVLDEGRIAAQGTFRELMTTSPLFRSFANASA